MRYPGYDRAAEILTFSFVLTLGSAVASAQVYTTEPHLQWAEFNSTRGFAMANFMARHNDAMAGTILSGSGSAPLVMRVTPNASEGYVPALAVKVQRYFPGASPADVTIFIRERIHDYAEAVRREGLVPESLPVGCDYAAESFYEVGSGQHISAGTTRRNIRATCALVVAAIENHGGLSDNARRQQVLQSIVAYGSTYRYRAAAYAQAHDDVALEANASNARASFKELFGSDEARLPPERFPCLMANKQTSCRDIMSQLDEHAQKINENYP
jgi:hypothetical protein